MNFKIYPQCRIPKLQLLLLLFFLFSETFVLAQTYHGKIGVGVSLGGWNLPFVDVAKTARSYTLPDGTEVQKDALGWPMADAQTVLMDMRPPVEWAGSLDDPEGFRLDVSGTYKCSFTGQARVVKIEGPFSLGPVSYDEATNTSSFDFTIDPPGAHHGVVILQFLDTKRTPTSAVNTGFTNFKAIRPGYDVNTTQLFTNELLNGITSVDFSTIRTMGGTRTNDNNKFYPEYFEWSERKTMDAATWERDNIGQENALPWEVIVDLANEANVDLWMNVPHAASDDYMRQLATLIKNRLNPELTLYLEYSNEVWNWSFPQSWWNDAKAKADGLNHVKGYTKRTVEMAKIFESVFGTGSLNTKVRVINAWQIGWSPPDAMYDEQMQYINTTFGPPKNFIYGLGVAPYFNCGAACETGTVQEIIDEMRRSSDASKLDRQKIVAVASKWQIPGGMVAYEGGSDTGGGSVENIANKIGAERSAEIREIFLRDLRQNWFDIGGGMFVYLELASSYNRYGSWGLTDDITNMDRNSKFGAVRDLIGTAATTAPEAPQGLTATPVGNANIELNWTASSSTNSYNIKRSTTSGGPFTVLGTTAATSFSDNTVTIGTTYYYVVSAVNSIGESANSAEVSVTPTEQKTIAREYWSNVPGSSVAEIPVTTTPTGTDELTSLEAPENIGDSYGARIRAYLKPDVSGDYTFYIASDDNSQLFLSTDKMPANKVKIAEVIDWTGYKEWTKNGTQMSGVVNLVAGQEYYIEILHKEGTGGDHVEVGWTGPGISTITVVGMANLARFDGQDTPTGPAAPTGLTATKGDASASLSWNAVAGATSYNVKRHTGGNFNTVATGVTATTYQDNNLVNGTTYFYVVTAVNANGESNISNTAQVTPASGGGDGSQTGTLASWDFTGSSGQTSVATTTAMSGVSTTAPSLVASLASGLTAVDYFANSLLGRAQTATTLADAIAGNDYISFTVTPEAGNTISVSSVKIRPISQSGSRTFVLMSNVNGFTEGSEISTFTSEGERVALTNIDLTGHSNINSAVEFRLYIYGNTNEWEAVGIGNRDASLAEADLIVEGSLGTSTVAVTGVSLSPASVVLNVDSTLQLTATVSPENATNKNVSWSSSDTSVATVSDSGLVTAITSGSAIITVTTQDGSLTATTDVTVNPADGGETDILASWDFAGPSGQTSVAATTAMPGVSTIAPSLVASLASGLTAVDYFTNSFIGRSQTATTLADAIAGNDYISFTITPSAGGTISVNSVKVRPVSQNASRTFVLMSNVSGFTAGEEISTFIASSEAGAALTSINVTGHSNIDSAVEFRLYVFGQTNEWEAVGLGGRHSSIAEADLIVEGSLETTSTVAVTGVSLSPASAVLSVDSTLQLTATVSPENATNKNLSWSSSDTTVATVNDSGLVTAVTSGSANITVTTQDGSFTAITEVTVPVVESPDTEAPTTPTGLAASAITTSSFTLNWTASTDDTGVTGYKVISNGALVVTTTDTTAQISGLSPETAYTITVSAFDAAENESMSDPLIVSTEAPTPTTITREVWRNFSGRNISDIPLETDPTRTTQLTSLEGPVNEANNYGARIRAYITPAVSGSYTFYIAGDDKAELWLSFNDNPGQTTKIAEVNKPVKPREWTKNKRQKSTARRLTAGVKYYVEVLHRETRGKDHVAVAWTGPGIPDITVIGGNVLSPFGVTEPEPTYTLSVNDGSGQGSYEEGSVVNISAIVPEGYVFSQWTGDIATVADIKAANTTITMPAANASVSATFIVENSNEMPTLNIGMDLGSVNYWSKQNAFKNMAKQSSVFLTSYEGGPWNTEEIADIPADVNGYPLELPYNGNVFIHAVLPFYYPEGRYVLTYDGEGEVKMNLNATEVSNTPGRLVFDYRNNDNGGLCEYKIIRSTLGNHVRNIVIVPIEMEGEDVLTNPFRDDFLEYLKPLQAQRYMGFMHINGAREQVEWSDRSLVGDYTYQSGDMNEDKYLTIKGLGGVPIEVCAQLSNILQQAAWFCVPHPASDDYIRQYARLVKEKMDPNLKTYIEYSNEIWNWAYAFPQSHYIINNAPGHPNPYVSADLAAISPNSDMHPEKDAYMIGRTMRLWTEEWAGELNRLVRVAAVQHGWVDNTRRILEYLQTNNLLQEVDAVSPAGYFGLNWEIRNNLNAKGAALTYQEVVDGVIETFETEEKPNTLAQAAYAQQFGKSYVAYEGGSHVDYRGDDTERLKELIRQFDDSQDVYDMYKRNFEVHTSPEVNCELFVALTYVSEPGAFGHLEYLGEPMQEAPKYRALVEASVGSYVPSFPATASSSTQAKLLFESSIKDAEIGIYPNPANNSVFIALNAGENEKVEMVIRSLMGTTVKTHQSSSAEDVIEIDTSNLPEGVYIISVQKGEVKTNHRLLIKR